MKLGIALPLHSAGAPRHNIVAQGARDAQQHGFHSVWFFDSIGRGRFSLDPLTAAAVAATAAPRLEIGIGILQIPLRNPVELAHRVLTTQLLCEGRLLLGVGAGSTPTDFQALGIPFHQRITLLSQNLHTMQQLWNGLPINNIALNPPPSLLGGPPIIIGSWASPRWISAAAQHDGWIASAFFSGFNTLRTGIDHYRRAGGKRAIVTNISIDLRQPPNKNPLADSDNTFHLQCPPDLARERLLKLAHAGFDDAIVVHRGQAPPNLPAIRALIP